MSRLHHRPGIVPLYVLMVYTAVGSITSHNPIGLRGLLTGIAFLLLL
jgi:hypothetical protein